VSGKKAELVERVSDWFDAHWFKISPSVWVSHWYLSPRALSIFVAWGHTGHIGHMSDRYHNGIRTVSLYRQNVVYSGSLFRFITSTVWVMSSWWRCIYGWPYMVWTGLLFLVALWVLLPTKFPLPVDRRIFPAYNSKRKRVSILEAQLNHNYLLSWLSRLYLPHPSSRFFTHTHISHGYIFLNPTVNDSFFLGLSHDTR